MKRKSDTQPKLKAAPEPGSETGNRIRTEAMEPVCVRDEAYVLARLPKSSRRNDDGAGGRRIWHEVPGWIQDLILEKSRSRVRFQHSWDPYVTPSPVPRISRKGHRPLQKRVLGKPPAILERGLIPLENGLRGVSAPYENAELDFIDAVNRMARRSPRQNEEAMRATTEEVFSDASKRTSTPWYPDVKVHRCFFPFKIQKGHNIYQKGVRRFPVNFGL
ncbi:uncharacterized protein LOC116180708 [Photinus pyralis]|uniref:uncharacterized protein LOC116180708 n=1 Tax=Photinus pyralis TaxID=7054 RepID=UPI0012672D22|nr:uncharacterized protein LOC116180708 [Photinus pyralis]